MKRPPVAVAVLVVVLTGLTLVVLGARSDTTRFGSGVPAVTRPERPTTPTASARDQPSAAPTRPGSDVVPGTFAGLLALLMVLLVIAGIVLLFPGMPRPGLRRRRRSWDAGAPRDQGDPTEESVRALADAVDEGLRETAAGAPKDAVVACWVRLETAAADAGTARRPSETATELAERVLAGHNVTPATLRRLVDLYREARFSVHALGEDAREQARAALEQVRRELARRGPGPGQAEQRETEQRDGPHGPHGAADAPGASP